MTRIPRTAVAAAVGAVAIALAAHALPAPAMAGELSKEEQRSAIRRMANETLARLYKVQPQAQATVRQAAGYAVFSKFDTKGRGLGEGKGAGVAVANGTRKETFMRMLEAQGGLGLGLTKFRTVFVFESKRSFDAFVNSGWQFNGQITAAAQLGEQGAPFAGASSVSPGIWMYQLTDAGLASDLVAKGTKYFRDEDLNKR